MNHFKKIYRVVFIFFGVCLCVDASAPKLSNSPSESASETKVMDLYKSVIADDLNINDIKNSHKVHEVNVHQILDKKTKIGKKVLTFAGYSQDYQDLNGMLTEAYKILNKEDPSKSIVNIGGTSLGIGAVYNIAKAMGFETIGVVSSNIKQAPYDWQTISANCDKLFIVHDPSGKWGGLDDKGHVTNTSIAMVYVSDEMFVLGGGAVSGVEMTCMLDSGKLVKYIPFKTSKGDIGVAIDIANEKKVSSKYDSLFNYVQREDKSVEKTKSE